MIKTIRCVQEKLSLRSRGEIIWPIIYLRITNLHFQILSSNCSIILDETVELEECDETDAVFGYRLVSWYKIKYCSNCGAKIDEEFKYDD